jgi:hypothetical protein
MEAAVVLMPVVVNIKLVEADVEAEVVAVAEEVIAIK